MKPKERRANIAALIERSGARSVEELSHQYEVSAETIRRDLAELAEEGMLVKFHGGARPRRQLHAEASFQERMLEDRAAKALIAEKLITQVHAGDTVFMDTGSTTLMAADALAQLTGLTIVTNSLFIAESFGRHASQTGNRVYLLGGTYGADNHQTVGADAAAQLDLYRADHAIITVAAIDARDGLMDADIDEAQLARAMIRRASDVIVLASSSKFDRRAAFRVCGFDHIDILVSEATPEGALADALEQAGVVVS